MTNELRPLTSAIHAEIRSWMKKKNLSQRQLAEKAGISKSKISRIIGTGEQAIDINELDAVCQVLGISTEILVLDAAQSTRTTPRKERTTPWQTPTP